MHTPHCTLDERHGIFSLSLSLPPRHCAQSIESLPKLLATGDSGVYLLHLSIP